MDITFLTKTDAKIISFALFILMLLSTWIGNVIGIRLKNKDTDKKKPETSGLTALLFFLLAFTFGMSGNRYDTRRAVVVEEANNIGTAILRADLYDDSERNLFRADFKEYVEVRIKYYTVGADIKGIYDAKNVTDKIAAKLWNRAARLGKDPANLAATQQMIPALNAMIDITTTRLSGERAKVPESILVMLYFLSCISAFYGGYNQGRKGGIDWLVETGFCLLVALVILFTLDLDRPRRGFVNLDTPNQTIIELRNNFK